MLTPLEALAWAKTTLAAAAEILKVAPLLKKMRLAPRIPADFAALAKKYQNADTIPDDKPDGTQRPTWDTRVRKKDVLAEGLARFAQGARLSRRRLAAVQEDGYVVALATLVIHQPQQGDLPLLARAAKCHVAPHADYRTLDAISRLIDRDLIGPQGRNQAEAAIELVRGRLGAQAEQRIADLRYRLRQPSHST